MIVAERPSIPGCVCILMEQLRNLDYGARYTPPSLRGTLIFPGFSGGAEWGGAAYDPKTRTLRPCIDSLARLAVFRV